ncbi:Tetratricopeptide repeat (TPR)-like superfamily protein [Hibiscus syriacus]|uniref:Tetratricopeptide repeat (TPR)-like superfamily protein n=1 Tax=Hibiscus syriacus TaxID=106335 RepID=A0A6A3CW60_HIBSY|nr:Tetratricopeptide repeat (TPR)-like superfamily protein [Hibiscus syriacus]
MQERVVQEGFRLARGDEKASEKSDGREGKRSRSYDGKDVGPMSREDYNGSEDRRSRWHNDDDQYKREDKRSRRHNDGDHEPRSVEDHHRKDEKRLRRHGDEGEYEARVKDDRRDESRSKRHGDDEFEQRPNGDRDRRGEKRFSSNESESYIREDHDKRDDEKRSGYNRNSSSHRHRDFIMMIMPDRQKIICKDVFNHYLSGATHFRESWSFFLPGFILSFGSNVYFQHKCFMADTQLLF